MSRGEDTFYVPGRHACAKAKTSDPLMLSHSDHAQKRTLRKKESQYGVCMTQSLYVHNIWEENWGMTATVDKRRLDGKNEEYLESEFMGQPKDLHYSQ